jgi:methionyl-tRNA formyltransferase
MSSALKLAFAGTPELASTILQKLIEAKAYSIELVFTRADKPAGRGRKLHKSAVKNLAEAYQLPLTQPGSALEFDAENKLRNIDILIVAAYGMLIPESVLNRPRLGCINVHTSLLPRWRGAAPIQRAIEAGDTETGITIMQMDAGLDTGDILLQKNCPIDSKETATTLHDKLAVMGAGLLLDALDSIETDKLQPKTQDDGLATYAKKINKKDAAINWQLSAKKIEQSVRAFNPSPIAHTALNQIQMRIWEVEVLDQGCQQYSPGKVVKCSANGIDVASIDQIVRIHKLQLPGKNIVTAAAFHNGHPDFAI